MHAEDQAGPSSRHAEVDSALNVLGTGVARAAGEEPVFHVLNENAPSVILHFNTVIDTIPQADLANIQLERNAAAIFVTKFNKIYDIYKVGKLSAINKTFSGLSYESDPPMSSVLELASLIQSKEVWGDIMGQFKPDAVQVRAIENRGRVVAPTTKDTIDEEADATHITPFYITSRVHSVGCGDYSDVTGIQAVCCDLVKNSVETSDEGSGFSSYGFELFDFLLYR